MGLGIDWMIAVALWVASLPGAVGRMAAFGIGPLLLGSAGLVVLCLLKTPLRWWRLLVGIAVRLGDRARRSPTCWWRPMAGVRGARRRRRLAMIKTGSDAFAVREWLAADGDARAPGDKTLGDGFRATRPAASPARGRLAGRVRQDPRGLRGGLPRAAVVLSPRAAPPFCAALLIDRAASRQSGAMELCRTGQGFEITVAAALPGYDRPGHGAGHNPERRSNPGAAGFAGA